MNPTKLRVCAGKPGDPFSDFRNFIHYLFIEVRGWRYVGELQYDIADFLQHLQPSADGIRRGQVQSLRGAGKTEILVAYALWLLYLNPDVKILAISSTQDKSQAFVDLARQLINVSPLLSHLKPQRARDGLVEKDQKDNLHGFVVGAVTKVSKELSLASYPIFGTFTGSHPDVILSDDVETPENSLTVGKRDKLLSKLSEFLDLINPGGIIVIQGTPQSEDSVYNKIEKRGYTTRRWPARAPDLNDEKACVNVSPWILKLVREGVLKPGQPTYPERFGEAQLLAKEAEYGPTRFALQMMLDTNLADQDRYPLKLRNLVVMPLHPEMAPEAVLWGTTQPLSIDPQGLPGDGYFGPVYKAEKYAPYTTGVLFIDPKGSGADTVGYAVVKGLNGMLFALEVGGLAAGKGNDGSSESVMRKLAMIAKKYKIKKVVVEKNFGDGMYAKLLAPEMAKINGPTEITEVHSGGIKEWRILDVLEPLVAQHKLVVDVTVAANDTLMYQYTRITRNKGSLRHEDELEALAGACAALAEIVALDPEQQEEVAKQKEKARMVRDFIKNAWGFLGTETRGTKRWQPSGSKSPQRRNPRRW